MKKIHVHLIVILKLNFDDIGHHLGKAKKIGNISEMISTHTMEEIEEEIKKCQLLCAK